MDIHQQHTDLKENQMLLRTVSAHVSMIALYTLLLSLTIPGIRASNEDVLLEMDLQFARDAKTKGLEGWLSYFADDATIFPSGLPVISGIEDIRKYYEKTAFDPRNLSWKPEKGEMSDSGDLGFTYGYWEIRNEQGKIRSKGKYLTVWRKNSEGNWKVVADIGAP